MYVNIPTLPLDDAQRAQLAADILQARYEAAPPYEDNDQLWYVIQALQYFVLHPFPAEGGGGALTTADKNIPALATAADGDPLWDEGITYKPVGYVRVFVRGVAIHVTEDKTGEAYWSDNGGGHALLFSEVVAGSTLHWNGSIAGYEVQAGWRVSLDYAGVPA